MQRNSGKPDAGRHGTGRVRSGGETKQVNKVHSRKVPYRVGYSWNKGGRLKELRIRHLARKFLHIWIHNTFGRVLPHEAKCHHDSVVLRRAFEGWREEWWMSRREWSLATRADCHYRYYLSNLVFHSWRSFMSSQREKKNKFKNAQLYADRQQMSLVWDRWEVFTEVRRQRRRMLESAFEQTRLATVRSAWNVWQTRLQQQQHLHTMEDQALKQWTLTLQRRVWLQWREKYTAFSCQKEKERRASLHFSFRLKRKALNYWICYVSCCQTKRKSQAEAQRACDRRIVKMCWRDWNNALHHRWSDEDRLQAAGQLATQSTQRRALERWSAYVTVCRDKAELNQMAIHHHHRHLLSAALRGLYRNVTWNKTRRLNNNMAIQHYYQTMTRKFWKLWQDRVEEAEDKSFQPLTEMAQNNYSMSLLSSCFHYWRENLAEQRHMQELECRADIWFAERRLPQCFISWVDFTVQRRLYKQSRHEADVFNQQRQYTWAFYTWWAQLEKHKEQMLFERMAILHEERCHMQRALARWRHRTEQRISEEEKQKASDRLYRHSLLHKTVAQWKDTSDEIRDRRNREHQACHQGDMRCMKWALEKWRKFVQHQRVKKTKLEEMQRYHECQILKRTLVAWKAHQLQMSHVYGHAEELHRQQTQSSLRTVMSVWRENAVQQAEGRYMEQQAQSHFQHSLQSKVLHKWREATTRAVLKSHREQEAVLRVQRSINHARLLQTFRQWRKQTRAARRERVLMEKARQHQNSKLLSKALEGWNQYHYHYQKYKVMKRQGLMLLRLKTYHTYLEQWKIQLQHRRREVKQTEQALWHWSLTLQSKVLYGWRLWVTEQRLRQEQAAKAAQVYRDQLLREGVTCILTYAARMNDLTTSLMQHSQEQGRSRHLQRVVKRCAMRWKQRALCKPKREQLVKEQPPKKSVTFCLTAHESKDVSRSDSVEQEAGGAARSKLPSTHMPQQQQQQQQSPVTVLTQKGPQNQFGITVTELPNQDLLLPPSAFMNPGSQNMAGKNSPLGSEEPPHLIFSSFKHNPRCPQLQVRAPSEDTGGLHVETDPASVLTRELLGIHLEMKRYQQDKKQLRAWQKLKEVLQSWLQTSGEDEQMEKNSVCQELNELEERIVRVSADLAKRKPIMLLHAERIRHLQTVLHTSGNRTGPHTLPQ